MKRKNYHIIRKIKIVFTAMFLISICLPILDWIIPYKISSEYDASENRELTKIPSIGSDVKNFPNLFEKYFNDNMNFREDLLNLNGILGFKQIKKESNVFVHEGKDGWCYVEKYIKAYENKYIFSEEQLDSLSQIFHERGSWLKKKNIHSYFAIVPTKAYIYPENLPNNIFQYQLTSRSDQLLKILNKNENIKGIDLSKSLLIAKNQFPEYPVFYKTDQHWNKLGALIGLKQIIDTIRKDFPQIKKININDYNISKESIEGKQLAELLKKKKQLDDFEIKLSPKETNPTKITRKKNYQEYPSHHKFPYKDEFVINYKSDTKNPKILIIRDSYTNALLPRFKEGCGLGDLVLVWDNWCYRLNEDITIKEEPEIHLTILIDGNIPFVLSHLPDYR